MPFPVRAAADRSGVRVPCTKVISKRAHRTASFAQAILTARRPRNMADCDKRIFATTVRFA